MYDIYCIRAIITLPSSDNIRTSVFNAHAYVKCMYMLYGSKEEDIHGLKRPREREYM